MSGTTAISVLYFTNKIGINTNLGGGATAYQNAAAAENALAYLGVTEVRDTDDSANDAAQFAQLNHDLGIRFDFFIAPGGAGFAWQLQQIEADPAIVAYVEGPNESDEPGNTQYYDGLSGLPATLAEMQALYASVHADPQLAGVQVIQASFGNLADFAVYGDQAGTADLANSHLYFGAGNNPAKGGWIGTVLGDAQIVTPGAPNIITETGYETMPGDAYAVSQVTQAKYLLDDLFDAFQAGAAGTFIFSLVDRGGSSPDGRDDYYGLYNSNWTAKPAAIALHNLLTILADPGTGGVAPGSLGYTLSGMPVTANSTLLEKSDGTFVLAVWNDADVTGATSLTDVPVAPVAVTLTLTRPYQSIDVYDPMTGTSAVQAFADAQTVTIMVPDHPVLIEISTGVIAAPGAGVPVVDAPSRILAAPGGIVQVAGVGVGGNPAGLLTVRVSDSAGTLAMQDANGQALAGSGTQQITLTGLAATVDAELATLSYAATAADTGDTIALQATDAAGTVATGFITVQPIALPVQQVAVGPLVSLPYALNVATGTTVAVSDAVLTDIYYAENPGTLTLTVSAAHGLVSLTANGVALAASHGITVSGPYAAVAADLATLTYQAGSGTGTDTLTVGVTDPSGLSSAASLAVDVVPAIAVTGATGLHLVAGTSGALGGLQIVDAAAAGNADLLHLTISDSLGTLSMQDGAGNTLPGSGTPTISFSGTPDEVNAALATLVATTAISLTAETVTLAVTDAAGRTGSASVPITVVPSVGIAAPASVSEAVAVIAPVTGIAVSDSFGTLASLRLTVDVTDTYGRLAMVDSMGNPLAGSGSHAIVLTGTLATVNAELATLTYTGPSMALTDSITIAASDSAGGAATQGIAVPVAAAPVLTTYFQLGDTAGDPFARQPVLGSGGMVLTAAATGLQAAASERVGATGTVTLASLGWNVVNSVNLADASGVSYLLCNFVIVSAALNAGPTAAGQTQTLTLDNALQGAVSFGSGTQSVVINAGIDGAAVSSSNHFSISGGSGTDTLVVNGYNSLTQVSVVAGSGNETMTFTGVGTVGVTGGSGNDTVHGGNAGNSITAGTGTMNAWGGTGADAYTYHAGDGTLTIQNFAAGDYLFIDRSLQPWMTATIGGSGVTLSFDNNAAHQIVLKGLTALPAAISWTGSAAANTPNSAGQYISIASPATLAASTSVIAPVAGLAIGDADAAANGLTMTVIVNDTYGKLAMLSPAGATLAGSGGHSMVLTGTLATVNAELATLTYTGPSSAVTDAITIAASDPAGGASTQSIAVPVAAAPTLATYFQLADVAGDAFARQPVLGSGGMTLTTAATGLAAAASEQVSGNGTVTLASLGWDVVNAVNLVDGSGASYVLNDFVSIVATLNAGPTPVGQAQSLTVNAALQGTLTLGSGNQNVVINAGLGGAAVSSSNMFNITEGSGTKSLVLNGYAGITQATVVAGTGTETMSFLNVGAIGVTGGSGNVTIHGGNNGNSITAGTGTMDVWGGTGADAFKYHAGDGVMTIENFGATDYLFIDKSLQPAMTSTVTGQGVQLQFGSASHEILLTGLSAVPAHITWS